MSSAATTEEMRTERGIKWFYPEVEESGKKFNVEGIQ